MSLSNKFMLGRFICFVVKRVKMPLADRSPETPPTEDGLQSHQRSPQKMVRGDCHVATLLAMMVSISKISFHNRNRTAAEAER